MLTVGEPFGGFMKGYLLMISLATLVYSSFVGNRLYDNIADATAERNSALVSLVIFFEVKASSTSEVK